jgi:hypothetical protein
MRRLLISSVGALGVSLSKLRGKLKLDVDFQLSGPINHRKPARYGTGMLTKAKGGHGGASEAVRVKTSTMVKEIGAHLR